MKKLHLMFVVLILFLFSHYNISGQSLDPSNTQDSKVKFTLSNLFQLLDNSGRPKPPFYEVFAIYGDGNYERISLRGEPIATNHEFTYTYRDLNNSFPGVTCLIARKDNRPPPPLSSMIFTPNVSTPDTYVNITKSSSLLPPPPTEEQIKLNVISDDQPFSPMIPRGSSDQLAMGLSHYFPDDGGFYFLERETVHALPIAYKPKKDGILSYNGILLFFYSSGKEGFDYYDEVKMTDGPTGTIDIGTIIPNYYQPTMSDPLLAIKNSILKMKEIQHTPDNSGYLAQLGITIPLNSYFDSWVAYNITSNDFDLFNSEVSGPPGNPDQKELRLFHFLKTSMNFQNPSEKASFLAVLYEHSSGHNQAKLDALNIDLLDIDPFNLQFLPSVSPDDNLTLKFADYEIIEAAKGEPDDPGGLTIESICGCCDQENVVTFELVFCNDLNADEIATGANITLISFMDGLSPSSPLLSEFKLISNCVSGVDYCQEVTPCNTDIDGISLPYTAFCFDFNDAQLDENPKGLRQGECGTIRFTAKMNASEVDRLIREPIMKYYVLFQGQFESSPFDSTNDILRDSICVLPANEIELICNPNPIWEDRDLRCQGDLSSENNCQLWRCILVEPAGQVVFAVVLGLLIVGAIRFFRSRNLA